MNILVVGAQFGNKGAQSMLFITINELKKHYPGCKVYFAAWDSYDEKMYNFHRIPYSNGLKDIAFANKNIGLICSLLFFKDITRLLRGKKKYIEFGYYFDLRELLKKINLMIDISGFNLGDKWNVYTNLSYLKNIQLAQKYKIPIYLMPQSFGPFEYAKAAETLHTKIKELMSYPTKIFTREEEGYNLLREKYSLTNVELSTDLVLQNTNVDLKNIFHKIPKFNLPEIITQNNVGIVPNKQCFNHGNREQNMKIYQKIVEWLLNDKKEVYLFRHSFEDLEICYSIKELFAENHHVHIIKNDFSCFEYDNFVTNFEFLIASRYHGIVHAYRNYIPCISLGWAIKYKELAKNVNQEEYVFDITDSNCSIEYIITALKDMVLHLDENRHKIKDCVKKIQKHNCFECLPGQEEII